MSINIDQTDESVPVIIEKEEDATNKSDVQGKWKNELDVIFACISATASLCNVWRFPILFYRNGGGAFLIVYLIAMVSFGIPVMYQELALGQYLGSGGMTLIGNFCPLLKGVGIASMILVFFLNIYHCVAIAWTFKYLIATLTALPGFPWDTCDNWWNTADCFEDRDNLTQPETKMRYWMNITTPAEEYWEHRVIQISDGMEYGLGRFQVELVVFLLLSWVVVYCFIFKGLHSSGKLIWVTAVFPLAIMAVLLVKALTLEGAYTGILYMILPDWSKLGKATTWIDAYTLIVFNFKIGLGCLPVLGSYNKFKHNTMREVFITCLVSTLTSLLMALLISSLLGYLAHRLNLDFMDVVSSGPQLTFNTFPELVSSIPGAPLWAFLFFLMLLIIGVSSQFCAVEGLVTGIVDNWPNKLHNHRKNITIGICVLLFILGLPMCTNGGMYLFILMDSYACSGMPLLFVCLLQTFVIGWVCGADQSIKGILLENRLNDYIAKIRGGRPNLYWIICWKFLIPIKILLLFIFQVAFYAPAIYGLYNYPAWAQGLGFLMSYSSMIWVPVYAVYYLLIIIICPKQPGTFLQKLKRGLVSNTEVNLDTQEKHELHENNLLGI